MCLHCSDHACVSPSTNVLQPGKDTESLQRPCMRVTKHQCASAGKGYRKPAATMHACHQAPMCFSRETIQKACSDHACVSPSTNVLQPGIRYRKPAATMHACHQAPMCFSWETIQKACSDHACVSPSTNVLQPGIRYRKPAATMHVSPSTNVLQPGIRYRKPAATMHACHQAPMCFSQERIQKACSDHACVSPSTNVLQPGNDTENMQRPCMRVTKHQCASAGKRYRKPAATMHVCHQAPMCFSREYDTESLQRPCMCHQAPMCFSREYDIESLQRPCMRVTKHQCVSAGNTIQKACSDHACVTKHQCASAGNTIQKACSDHACVSPSTNVLQPGNDTESLQRPCMRVTKHQCASAGKRYRKLAATMHACHQAPMSFSWETIQKACSDHACVSPSTNVLQPGIRYRKPAATMERLSVCHMM